MNSTTRLIDVCHEYVINFESTDMKVPQYEQARKELISYFEYFNPPLATALKIFFHELEAKMSELDIFILQAYRLIASNDNNSAFSEFDEEGNLR